MLKSRRKKPTQRTSRSVRLKKYEILYEECLKRATERESRAKKSPVKKHEKKSRKRPVPVKKSRAKHLNEYQEFVREESKKATYKNMSATDRMKAIGKLWKNKQDLNGNKTSKKNEHHKNRSIDR